MSKLSVERSHFKDLNREQKLDFVQWISQEYKWYYDVGPLKNSLRKWYLDGDRK
jgi:hypothetical protein